MSRVMAGLAIGALLVAGLAIVALRPGEATSLAERSDALAAELRCPDCQGLSVADSPTAAAAEIRRQIDELLAGGADDDEVRAYFTARYGEWILLAPSAPLTWIAPFAIVLSGLLGLAAWILARRRVNPAAPPALNETDRRRLHDEAEALDA